MDPQLPSPPLLCSRYTATASPVFKVHRRPPELVSPAKPTPRELKLLSDIDDQDGLRFQFPTIQIYRSNPSKTNVDPVRVIRQALAETLVHFYPFAGRLREGPNRKLMVDCTGEGVMFIEADADVTLDDFGDDLQPPFPCFEELLFDVPGSNGVLNSPLLLIQVTRLKCGSFILALRLNHTMSDGAGLFLFLYTLAETARGANAPTIQPAWDRHLLRGRSSPRVTHVHREYDEVLADADDTVPAGCMIHRSFFFGRKEIYAIRRLIPSELRDRSSTVETLTSFLWRCRTVALRPKRDAEMRIMLAVNMRNKLNNPPLPRGYYGNAMMIPVAVATAKDIMEQPLEFAIKLVKKMKHNVTEEYLKSVLDLMVARGRPNFTSAGTFIISDLTRAGFRNMDFGWGKPVYVGPAMAGAGAIPGVSFFVPHKNKQGEVGIVVPICLPEPAMERFVEELDRVFAEKQASDQHQFIISAL